MIEFMKQNWVMFSIGGLIMILSIGGVVWGVLTKGRWKDRGFMTFDGKPLRWPTSMFPITVYFSEDLSLKWIEVFRKAAEDIQQVLGRPFFDKGEHIPKGFDPSKHPPAGMVYLITSSDASSLAISSNANNGGATTQHRYDTETGEILSAVVTLSFDPPQVHAYKIMIHELGHVMGLDHDEHPESIMFPSMLLRPQSLTSQDKKILRSAYS